MSKSIISKSTTALLASTALIVAACSSTPTRVDTVEAARSAISRVENQPRAGEVAAAEVEQAHNDLRNAEALAKKGAARAEIDHAAYLAQRHAEIAQEQIARAESRKIVADAQTERDKVVLQARAQEANAKAAQATQEANRKAEQAELNAQQAEEAKQRAAMLEKELAELNAKKTDRGMVLTLGDVLFDSGKAALKPGAQSTIDRLAEFLKNSPESNVLIEGHTDSVGADDFNMALSQQRANSVRDALLSRNVNGNRISATGKGESTPVAGNDTAGGRQQNRRVEIIIQNAETTG
ncbi:MAG: OmpA family protein [Steroidobacteraceae bacterium]